MLRQTAFAVTVVLALAACPVGEAQTSEYFVLSGDQATFSVLQGGVRLRDWAVASGTAQYQYPIAVRDTIRTMGANEGDVGAEYDFSGTDLGARFTHPAGPGRTWDGTTDGQWNYGIDTGGGVYRFDLDWSNPSLLFGAGSVGSLTYDPTNDSLWVSQFSNSTVIEYSMGGAALRSFDTGHTQNMALALDHADGTLWLHDRTTQGTFEQWTKSGTRLTRVAVPGMAGQNALAGEFQLSSEPCAGFVCGDASCDGIFNGGDIDPFFEALGDPAAWQAAHPGCDLLCVTDVNHDGELNGGDIDPFFLALGGGGCP